MFLYCVTCLLVGIYFFLTISGIRSQIPQPKAMLKVAALIGPIASIAAMRSIPKVVLTDDHFVIQMIISLLSCAIMIGIVERTNNNNLDFLARLAYILTLCVGLVLYLAGAQLRDYFSDGLVFHVASLVLTLNWGLLFSAELILNTTRERENE